MDRIASELFLKLLKESGKTQVQLAEEAGIGQGTISKLTKPSGYSPTIATLQSALRALGVRASDFFLQIEGRLVMSPLTELARMRESAGSTRRTPGTRPEFHARITAAADALIKTIAESIGDPLSGMPREPGRADLGPQEKERPPRPRRPRGKR
jgi:transcriptional regulator with XRE-family HTH domain